MKRRGNLAEFFAASPLRGSGLKVERVKDDNPLEKYWDLSNPEVPSGGRAVRCWVRKLRG